MTGIYQKWGGNKIGCKCAIRTDEYHGWGCTITGGACMYFIPNSKACAKDYGEGPNVKKET
jgi:hypothetical protein